MRLRDENFESEASSVSGHVGRLEKLRRHQERTANGAQSHQGQHQELRDHQERRHKQYYENLLLKQAGLFVIEAELPAPARVTIVVRLDEALWQRQRQEDHADHALLARPPTAVARGLNLERL